MSDIWHLSKWMEGLPAKSKQRVRKYLEKPTTTRWTVIASLPLAPNLTAWQTVMLLDLTFPRTGRVYDARNRMTQDWQKIPEKALLLKALKYAYRKRRPLTVVQERRAAYGCAAH